MERVHGAVWPEDVKVRLQTGPESVTEDLGCHWPVTIVTKKYLLSPSSGPGSGLGIDKGSSDALGCLCCHPVGRGDGDPAAPQPSRERQVRGGLSSAEDSETQRWDMACLRCHMDKVTLFLLFPFLFLSISPLFIHPSFRPSI